MEDRKQALAVAYSIKRKNAKKMARGGSVENENPDKKQPQPVTTADNPVLISVRKAFKMADGGEVDSSPMMSRGGIAKAIMKKRMMAEGGLIEDSDQADDFLSDEMDEDAMIHDEVEEPQEKRKKMLSSIMAGIHKGK
jgi:hypothetical protein